MNKFRFLFSSDDYGSAEQNYFFIKKNKYIDKKNSIILSNEITKKIYKKTGIKKQFLIRSKEKKLSRKILENIKKKKINFFIVGLNSKNFSIDKKILDLSKKLNIQSGCIQDYWGNYGFFTKKNSPNFFWVLDLESRRFVKTKLSEKTKILITGSPKYDFGKYLINKKKYNIKKKKIKIIIISQPLNILGIKNFYKDCVDFLNKIEKKIKIYLLEHPKDDQSIKYIRQNLNFFNFKILKKKKIQKLKENNMVISISCFSTMTYDMIFNDLTSNNQSLNIFYQNLNFKKNLKKKLIGLKKMPLIDEKIAIVLSSKAKIEKIISSKNFFLDLSTYQKKNSSKYFKKMKNSSMKITKSIVKDNNKLTL